MSNLQEILKTESDNTDKIHFYREGVFYKAYEKSAYLFVTHVKPFMVKKLFVKSVNQEVVSIGFPTNSLRNYFAADKIREKDNEAEVPLDVTVNLSDFESWRERVVITPSKEPSARINSKTSIPVDASENERIIAIKIKTFPIEIKTPLECMVFLSELKKIL